MIFKGIGDYDSVLHMILYTCGLQTTNTLDSYAKEPAFDCSDFLSLPQNLRPCLIKNYVNIHRQNLCNGLEFETNTGLPMADIESKYAMLFVHRVHHVVGNREKQMGLRVYHTEKLIANQLDHMMAGIHPSIYGVLVPPNRNNFVNVGHCSYRCFKEVTNSRDYITITHIEPHVHTKGTKILIRHFRGNEELDQDNDVLSIECYYNNTLSNETLVTTTEKHGGEMCLAFMYYYPPVKGGGMCFSMSDEETLLQMTNLEQITGYWLNPQPIIIRPKHWNNTRVEDYIRKREDYSNDIQNIMRFSNKRIRCNIIQQKNELHKMGYVNYPDSKHTVYISGNGIDFGNIDGSDGHSTRLVHNEGHIGCGDDHTVTRDRLYRRTRIDGCCDVERTFGTTRADSAKGYGFGCVHDWSDRYLGTWSAVK
ncbi:unnamed protein product [Medioppia subpectinata]|uniref:Copper type II ascorbate-dependent monooxygenase C-terminal domain-containing protein n=1 Tax=Medioppia subpectinata TaxID=1979941 RepID=A0A7R9L9G1_9ACAR|nr:unnamed protein product [Medioppia subpectinata]CAG2116676.1 unnamed protein product [Medioppia subpectinata]